MTFVKSCVLNFVHSWCFSAFVAK